ncbi:MAG: 16S rRNA (adenine(1518)-N(6)/adenine(1519)-N(6))-dimethyltransferase RsmA [Actinomycetota bacterium]|nr:16S rRNA (adenine(1518)-N(6)/adenine(1519)-N(6))-dimethyltransferase RsmA [Actinomycetota bacterium]
MSTAGPRLTPAAVRALAARHGIRPKKSLGQHFLIEPALARRIVELAEIGPGDRVAEVGAGLGSLTLALAQAAGEVLALELDRALLPALHEVVGDLPRVRVVEEDALRVDWGSLLGPGGWKMVANLPYNVAVPVVMRTLEEEPRIEELFVMVQREVGERLVATPGDEQYGAVSLRVAYRAAGRVVRRVPTTVFWPEPKVESVLVSLVRRPPPVSVDESVLWRVVDEAFAQRRKTLANALVRLEIERPHAEAILSECGLPVMVRAEQLDLASFACVAERWAAARAVP